MFYTLKSLEVEYCLAMVSLQSLVCNGVVPSTLQADLIGVLQCNSLNEKLKNKRF